ncbi:MAG: DciA family protein [Pseudomonadota bacterium]|nr:DciA family protein [Pseudomonadota bacterium]
MSPESPRCLADLLADGQLGTLAHEARSRHEITEKIRSLLPVDQAKHLISASVNDSGDLVLLMDSSAWAARARYSARQLGVNRLKVKVLPSLNQSDRPGTN